MRKVSIKEVTKKKKGFTLIELIIVIAIIAILAAMAIPKFGEIRESANQKTDLATAKQIATAVATCIANNESVVTGTATGVTTTDLIGKKIDGDLKPKSKKAGKAVEYTYLIDGTTGNITVKYSGGNQVYPETADAATPAAGN